jgi:hypothetical protein
MGILDDAIRQHLELKRQHGASEDEIQRQEEEALGPARRDIAPAEPAGDQAEEALEEAPIADAASEQETELYEPATAESDSAAEPEGGFEPEAETAFKEATGFDSETDTSWQTDGPTDVESERGSAFERESETAFERDQDEPAPDDEADVEAVPEPEDLPPSPAPFDASSAYDDFADEDEPEQEEPEGAEGDVLEDTPDFLQETPEHDRLWFEQRPPRDFDFD